jgi:NADPH-dependent 2,4-dienoyl-CoA reductase/sulfur reductase-like enzyme
MAADLAFEVVVVGAGPAGIAAATVAAESGRRVGVLDENPAAGGQIWRRESNEWIERFALSGAVLLSGVTVYGQSEQRSVLTSKGIIRYSKLILATGARERFLPFPGWTLPNVMGAGGLQAMVKNGLPLKGKRVVVAGTGPLLLAVAAYLNKHGADVRLIAEQARLTNAVWFGLSHPSKLPQALALRLQLLGTLYEPGCWVVRASGKERLESVELRQGTDRWTEDCDYLACGFGLTPNVELPVVLGCGVRDGFVSVNEWQETTVSGVYCAGEPTGIGGVEKALVEGRIAGFTASGQSKRAKPLFGDREYWRRFQRELERAFALRKELRSLCTASTVVCRCEEVTLGAIQEQQSWRSAKLQTRCGMGPCQGRVCGPAVEFLTGWKPESIRPPAAAALVSELI